MSNVKLAHPEVEGELLLTLEMRTAESLTRYLRPGTVLTSWNSITVADSGGEKVKKRGKAPRAENGPPSKRGTPAVPPEMIAKVRGALSVTAWQSIATVAEAAGVERQIAKRVIDDLVKADEARTAGGGRGTKYALSLPGEM